MASRGRRKNYRNPLTEGVENKRRVFINWGLLVMDKYYIVDLINILKPRYIPKPLDSRQEARLIINCFLDGNYDRFTIETGKTIGKYGIKSYRTYLRSQVTKRMINLKYNYPSHRTTLQQKKDFRTMARRRMRKWIEKLELS